MQRLSAISKQRHATRESLLGSDSEDSHGPVRAAIVINPAELAAVVVVVAPHVLPRQGGCNGPL